MSPRSRRGRPKSKRTLISTIKKRFAPLRSYSLEQREKAGLPRSISTERTRSISELRAAGKSDETIYLALKVLEFMHSTHITNQFHCLHYITHSRTCLVGLSRSYSSSTTNSDSSSGCSHVFGSWNGQLADSWLSLCSGFAPKNQCKTLFFKNFYFLFQPMLWDPDRPLAKTALL